jgi:hypothetical protein
MALRIYRSPEGFTFQYEEGTQPEGYEPLTPDKPKAAPKRRRTTNNKAAKPADK